MAQCVAMSRRTSSQWVPWSFVAVLTACSSPTPPEQPASLYVRPSVPAQTEPAPTAPPGVGTAGPAAPQPTAQPSGSELPDPPPMPATGAVATAEQLSALDSWAEAAGFRDDPLRWSVMVVPLAMGVGTSAEAAFSPKEAATRATVTIVEDGYLDDSVRGRRYVLTFVRTGAVWTSRSISVEQRCWPGRGHESFSADPCS